QRFDTPRRLEEHRTHRQRCLPLVVAQLHIILLLVLGEQRVPALRPRCRGQQRRQPVVLGGRGGRGRVELIVEAVGGSAAAAAGCWQSSLLCGRQREHLPAEEVSRGPVAEQSGDPPSDGGLRALRMTASYGDGDRLQTLPQPY